MCEPWRAFDPGTLEREYNPRLTVGDPAPFFAAFARASEAARAELRHTSDIRYGPGPLETFDLFSAPEPGGPIHLFFHGGYWRSQDKRDYAFVARHLVPAGINVVIANYDLCPALTIAGIEDESRRCLDYVRTHAAELGGDAQRISLSGHSAGAQLVARLLADNEIPVTGALALSGVFDLEPLPGTSINTALRLDAAEARARSPRHWRTPAARTPIWLVVGAAESGEFRRQTHEYAGQLRGAGCTVRVNEFDGANHFTVLERMFADSEWRAELLEFIHQAQPGAWIR